MIFYAAFLHLNKFFFFPNYNNSDLFPILISWLNLDFGFNVCFYNGLTSYAKVWLQFIFPIYLYVIEIIIVVSSYKSSKLARVTGARNRLKVLSTIFLLGYMKMLRVVMIILSYTNLQLSTGIKTVWLYDGSIEYFSKHHTPLFIVAVLFLTVISVPYTCYLLTVQLILRFPYFPCKVERHGIIDAHVGPFKEKFRSWLGLLLFSYTVLVSLYYFTGGNRQINLTALTVTCVMLLLLKILLGGVYKSRLLDSLESLFLFSLSILSVIILQLSNTNTRNIKLAVYLLVSASFVLILVTLIYHIYYICASKHKGNRIFNFNKMKFRYPWSNNYRHLDEQLPLDSFETEYEDAGNLIDGTITETQNSLDLVDELVPSDWIPTKYPVPVFREDPKLLKADSSLPSATCTSDSLAKPSLPDVIKVRSSVLTVDDIEEEANLTQDSNERSQRLSVDHSGNRTFVIEDNQDLNCTCVSKYHAVGKRFQMNPPTKEANNLEETKPSTMSTGEISKCEKEHHEGCIKTSSDSIPVQQSSNTRPLKRSRRVSVTNRLPLHSSVRKSKKSRKPRRGSVCYKCFPKLFLQSKIERFKVDQHGREYAIHLHDVTIKIPPSAIVENHFSMDIEVGIMLTGPFVFPQNIRPISPIIWICIRNEATLCKPVEITLPHFLKFDALDSNELGLRFMKANHRAPRLFVDGSKKFVFSNIGNDDTVYFTSHRGKLQTDHFCFLCIAAPDSRAICERASYCLTRVEPITWNPSKQKQDIYFIVSYSIKTCLDVSKLVMLF